MLRAQDEEEEECGEEEEEGETCDEHIHAEEEGEMVGECETETACEGGGGEDVGVPIEEVGSTLKGMTNNMT